MSLSSARPACAGIRIKPPWILAGSGAFAIAFHALTGWSYTADVKLEAWLGWTGYAMTGCGGLLVLLADWQFRRHGTDSDCGAPDTALVTTGPYRFTRNPIYVSFAVIFAGCSLSANAPVLALSAIPMLWALHRFVVLPEEAHLDAAFGDDYRGYAGRVRRWI